MTVWDFEMTDKEHTHVTMTYDQKRSTEGKRPSFKVEKKKKQTL